MKTLFRTRGLVQDLHVTSKGPMVTLWSELGTRHTVFDSASPHMPGLEYARNMLAVLAFCPQPRSCLVLGLGGGSIPRMLLAARPQMEVDAVEIDPVVAKLAAEYFNIRALPNFTIYLDDAAAFVQRCTSRYSLVIVDTYIGEQFPDQCTTQQFIEDAGKCLMENGVLALNWLSDDLKTRERLLKSLGAVVGPVWQLPCLDSGNILYFATEAAHTRSEIIDAAGTVQAEIPFENSLKRLSQRLRGYLCGVGSSTKT
jgi:spermidine synthase